jgi:predicted  nucleic acid-binding Zn-ribbon protein
MKNLVERMEASVDDKKTRLRDAEKWYNEQMDALKDYNDRMAKIKASLNAVTKTKDYLLRQKELENLRRHKQSKEEEIEKVKAMMNDVRDAIDRDLQRINELKTDTEQEGGATWDRVHELEDTIGEISKRRASLLPIIPTSVQRRYEQVKSRREGVAIVPANDGSCGGCHVQLRPQLFNILLRAETIEACPRCNRFVFVNKEDVPPHMLLQLEAEAEAAGLDDEE